jgi:intracellular sulfur oxidation DsrE/DsrF family protein
MNNKYGTFVALLSILAFLSFPIHAQADEGSHHSNVACPAGLVSGLTLDEEFGPGASTLTHCVKVRHHLQVAVEINRKCRGSMGPGAVCDGSGPAALGNMENMIKDYEITNGMKRGLDYKMIAIVHGSGGFLLIKGNEYESRIQNLMDEGVKFYFCQNTARGFIRGGILTLGDATSQLIDGVEYVTAGFTALADRQQQGWSVVTP